MDNSMNKSAFCRRPFESIEVGEAGFVRICCWTDGYRIGNVNQQDLMEIWNGPKAKAFRDSIFDGSYRFCDKTICPYFSKGNKLSEVLIEEARLNEDLSEIISPDIQKALKQKDRHLAYRPKTIVLCHDPSCNLSCPTCRTGLVNKNSRKEEFRKVTDCLKPFADRLIFSGSGDPFFSAHFLEFMFSATEEDLSEVREINLMTNGLLLTPQTWAKVGGPFKRKSIVLDISIDAANELTYAKNRRGGDWGTLINNLEFISNCPDFKQVTLSFVVQKNNFREMKDFVRLADRYGAKVSFRKMGNWGTFSQIEFLERNICSRSHPEHQSYLEFIKDPVFQQRHIEMPADPVDDGSANAQLLPGLGISFFSQGSYQNSITANNGIEIFAFNGTDIETDFTEFQVGYFSHRFVAAAPEYMGFGFFHNTPFSLSPYEHIHVVIKSNFRSMEGLNFFLLDEKGREIRIRAADFGFKADGHFHKISVPLKQFSERGIDLKSLKYTFGIIVDNVNADDCFYLNDVAFT